MDEQSRIEYSKMSRRGLVSLAGAGSLAALFGDTNAFGSSAVDLGALAANGKFNPDKESGAISVFEWEGYDAKEMWAQYTASKYGKSSPLKFTFLQDDQQALAKVAAGAKYDIIHPCVAYTTDWVDAGLIQPWDTSMLPDFKGIPAAIRKGGNIGGKQYHVAFDVGFSTICYDADAVDPDDAKSWALYTKSKYKGKMACFSDGVAITKIGALINAGSPINPNHLTSAQIDASKKTMMKVKKNLRSFWTSQTQTVNDFVNGNLIATYAWPDGYWRIKNHPKMKGRNIQYMWPKEGRLAWVCGFVLSADTKVPGRSHLAVAAANTPKTAAWLVDAFQYSPAEGGPNVRKLIKNKKLIKAFSLDDPTAFAAPRAWFEVPLKNRKDYVAAAEEVKAS